MSTTFLRKSAVDRSAHTAAYGALALRLALGAMWFSHGFWKLFSLGPTALEGFLASQHLPTGLAIPLIVAELGGGVLMLLGFGGRWLSLALAPILMGAIGVHLANGFIFSLPGGGFEYPLFLLIASLAHAAVGDGAFALSGLRRAALTAA